MNELFPKPEPKFDINNNKKYKVEVIKNNAVYTKKAKKYLPGLYYLVTWKSCLEKKKT